MEKEDNYSAPNFTSLDYGIDHDHNHYHQQQQQYHHHHHHESTNNYMVNNLPQQQQHLLSFADVMHFADFGPKLALNQTRISEEDDEEQENDNDNDTDDQSGIDPVYFLKFPVLNDKNNNDQSLVVTQHNDDEERLLIRSKDKEILREEDHNHDMNSVQLQFLGEDLQKNSNSIIGNPSSSEPNINNNNNTNNKNKRKRPRTLKTNEEVESQRMTHIAVERNRRKQMNEHLRVLRSLMPGSYVQRGDQASIIGGAIEFVRELEQLLQCLESQKRRRLLGDQTPRSVGPSDPNNSAAQPGPVPPFFPPSNDDVVEYFEGGGGVGGLREETAENKSCLADVEVKLLGFDAMIKILSRRRPGQLIKAIAALEDLQFNILHTNITTIEQTVLYSFNVKVTSEARFSAEDIASSVQQIFSFIHANTTM